MKRNNLIIFVSILPWTFPLDYLKQLAICFSEKNSQILFISTNEYFPILSKSMITDRIFKRIFFIGISFLSKITFINPFTVFYNSKESTLNLNQFRLFNLLILLLIQIKGFGRKKILFVTYPYDFKWLSHIPHDVLIYDCMEYPYNPIKTINQEILSNHEKLLSKATFTTVNSKAIYRVCAPYCKDIYKVSAGFNLKPFLQNNQMSRKLLPRIKKPIIGFVGYSFMRIDINFLLSVVESTKKYSFVFVGPLKGKVEYSNQTSKSLDYFYSHWSKILKCPNVYHINKNVELSIVENYIQNFDVCIIPYNISEIPGLYANTIKAYEYLALGKKIVSTNILPLQDLKQYIEFASSPKEFSQKLQKVVNKTLTGSDIQKRKYAAEQNTAQLKTTQILNLLKRYN